MADKGIHVFYFVQLAENGLFLAGGAGVEKTGRLPVSAEAGLKNQCGIWLHQDHLSGSMPGNQGTIPAKRRNRAAAGGKERPAYKKGFICSTLACSVDSSFSAKDRTCRSFPS